MIPIQVIREGLLAASHRAKEWPEGHGYHWGKDHLGNWADTLPSPITDSEAREAIKQHG